MVHQDGQHSLRCLQTDAKTLTRAVQTERDETVKRRDSPTLNVRKINSVNTE